MRSAQPTGESLGNPDNYWKCLVVKLVRVCVVHREYPRLIIPSPGEFHKRWRREETRCCRLWQYTVDQRVARTRYSLKRPQVFGAWYAITVQPSFTLSPILMPFYFLERLMKIISACSSHVNSWVYRYKLTSTAHELLLAYRLDQKLFLFYNFVLAWNS